MESTLSYTRIPAWQKLSLATLGPTRGGPCGNTRIKSTRMVTEPWSYWFYWLALIDKNRAHFNVARDRIELVTGLNRNTLFPLLEVARWQLQGTSTSRGHYIMSVRGYLGSLFELGDVSRDSAWAILCISSQGNEPLRFFLIEPFIYVFRQSCPWSDTLYTRAISRRSY